MTVLIYPFNSSGMSAAIGAADFGADVIAVEPSRVDGAMWLTGLEQTDREGTFLSAPNTDIRWGVLKEASVYFQAKAPTTIPYLFPDLVTVTDYFHNRIAGYATRVAATSTKRAKGKITVIKEQELLDIVRDPISKALTGFKFVDNSTSERKVVQYNTAITNAIDVSDEGDLAALVCSMRTGREGMASSGEPAAGVRPGTVNGALGIDPTTGERLPNLNPKPWQQPGMSDRRLMAFNMRILVTTDATRINWADIVIPGYNARDYDTELKIAIAKNYTSIPGSIGTSNFKPGQGVLEYDMNNGSLVQIGSNWIGRFLKWFGMSWTEREVLKDQYILRTLGLFKAICSDAQWLAALPAMVTDTKLWGLIPGYYTFPAWGQSQTVKIGDRRFVAPYIYEVTGVVGDDGLTYNTFTPAAWATSTSYAIGVQRSTASGRYEVTARVDSSSVSAASGNGPTGTGTGIVDGGLTWKYVGVLVPTAPTNSTGTGPSGAGTGIADGARVTWKMLRPFFPGMSPTIYVREGRRLSGQAEQTQFDVSLPHKKVDEPITAYGYPHFDAHWVNRYVNDNGLVEYEGGSGLGSSGDKLLDAQASLMKLGSIKPARRECPNLLVVRASSGTKLGWIVSRIELSYMKIGEAAGIIAGIADQLGVHTDDLDYESQIKPALIERGAILTILGAAA